MSHYFGYALPPLLSALNYSIVSLCIIENSQSLWCHPIGLSKVLKATFRLQPTMRLSHESYVNPLWLIFSRLRMVIDGTHFHCLGKSSQNSLCPWASTLTRILVLIHLHKSISIKMVKIFIKILLFKNSLSLEKKFKYTISKRLFRMLSWYSMYEV